MASCAQDDLTGEQFGSGVRNSQLVAPSADQISVTPSTDGSQQIIAWPVVEGAGGYHAVLTNVDNGEVVKDTHSSMESHLRHSASKTPTTR